MKLTFQKLEQENALAILKWRYPAPYDRYNFNIEAFPEDLCYLLERKNAFFALLNPKRELEGYCSFGTDGQVPGGCYSAEALDIGMGIRPDLVGRKLGKQYARAVAKYGANQYTTKHLRVTIADFNKRAQRVWQQLGFEQVEKFIKIGTFNWYDPRSPRES
ncbi:MAG: GNAT family N-acetyltransferase [Cyanobacteriota bacterium]|nr:GNAT family N-acetyltransferase [Cyanobacteriota bacterium]